jgi:gluconolactonase
MHIDMTAPGLERLVESHPLVDRIAHGLQFGEGPVWDRRSGCLYFADIIGNTIYKWKPGVGKEVVLTPTRYSNGMTFDRQGRMLVAGWCSRTVWRMDRDGTIATLMSHFEGKKLHTPNDIVVRSDGAIYFSDMSTGLIIPGMLCEDIQRYLDFEGHFMIRPDGTVQQLTADFVGPNGLAFSPDESLLYLNDTRLNIIRVFKVNADGTLRDGALFHTLTGAEEGVADGMKVDAEGNVYCTGPGGIHVLDPAGRRLGRMRFPGHVTNMAWGDADWRSLFVTTHDSVYRVRMKVSGVPVW